MNIEKRDIDELLPAYLSGELSDEQQVMINDWRRESAENESFFQETLRAWEAIPLLHEMEQFNSFDALKTINSRLSKVGPSKWWAYTQRVAAILLLPLLIYSGYVTFSTGKLQSKEQVLIQTISSRQGMVSQFALDDGTKVWLNSNSELKFPVHFTGKMREVALKGEAYFEVVKNAAHPFRVNAKDLHVDVLGTSFNVVSYEDDNQTEVVLVEGKVSLSSGNDLARRECLTMSPGQRSVYQEKSQNISTEEVDVEKYTAWRDGNLIFKDDNMTEVVKRLSRWFNVEIVINDPEIKGYFYKATFRNESLIQVLDLLKISAPIDYEITGNKVLPNGEFSKRKVFLMKKKS